MHFSAGLSSKLCNQGLQTFPNQRHSIGSLAAENILHPLVLLGFLHFGKLCSISSRLSQVLERLQLSGRPSTMLQQWQTSASGLALIGVSVADFVKSWNVFNFQDVHPQCHRSRQDLALSLKQSIQWIPSPQSPKMRLGREMDGGAVRHIGLAIALRGLCTVQKSEPRLWLILSLALGLAFLTSLSPFQQGS